MKKISYKGSLTDDLKIRKYRNQNSIKEYIITLALVMLSFIILKCFLGYGSTSFLIPMFVAKYCLKVIDDHEKKQTDAVFAHDRITFLAHTLKSASETLEDTVVISSSEIEEGIDEYIELITSEIYYLDLEDKIQVLKEIKKIIKKKDGDATHKETELLKLEETDLESIPSIPVKQVLKLR